MEQPKIEYKPEKLSFWEWLFCRRRKVFVNRGTETWCHTYYDGANIPGSDFKRNWVEYHIVDRLTGDYVIKKEYL